MAVHLILHIRFIAARMGIYHLLRLKAFFLVHGPPPFKKRLSAAVPILCGHTPQVHLILFYHSLC